jgi:hypothetical protein
MTDFLSVDVVGVNGRPDRQRVREVDPGYGGRPGIFARADVRQAATEVDLPDRLLGGRTG